MWKAGLTVEKKLPGLNGALDHRKKHVLVEGESAVAYCLIGSEVQKTNKKLCFTIRARYTACIFISG